MEKGLGSIMVKDGMDVDGELSQATITPFTEILDNHFDDDKNNHEDEDSSIDANISNDRYFQLWYSGIEGIVHETTDFMYANDNSVLLSLQCWIDLLERCHRLSNLILYNAATSTPNNAYGSNFDTNTQHGKEDTIYDIHPSSTTPTPHTTTHHCYELRI